MGASYVLFWHAINYFAGNGLKRLDLGGGTGVKPKESDGLSRFKRGWSTDIATSYFCGRIFCADKYEEIVGAEAVRSVSDYFPAYRKGEFV